MGEQSNVWSEEPRCRSLISITAHPHIREECVAGMEFFRHCPGCGRRFHIKLVDKKMVHLDRESLPVEEGPLSLSQYRGSPILLAQESSRPIIVDVEEFQYSYKCKHCGHEWFEKRVEEHREG